MPSSLRCWLSLVLVVAGCGAGGRVHGPGGDGSDGGTPGAALTLLPADTVLPVDGKTPATAHYRVLKNGIDVTAQAVLSVDNGKLGAFSGPTFTSTAGAAGKTNVRATVGMLTGITTLTVKVTTVVLSPGVPANAPSQFAGPGDPSHAPSIAYPPDGVLVPPNLNELEIHYTTGGNSLFEIGFEGDAVDLRIYTKCNSVTAGCAFLPDQATWNLLSQAGRGQTVMVTVRGSSGGVVGTAPPVSLGFADEDIQGGLYYWGAAAGGVYRYDFGLRGQKAETFYSPTQAGGATMCVGCHALSRDGKRIAVGLNIPGPSTMRILDVATRKTLYELGSSGGFGPSLTGSNFEALTADGSKIVTTESGGLTLRDATTGALIGQNPAVSNADMPDFSPDSSHVVFARGPAGCVGGICSTLSVMGAGIYTVGFNGKSFGGAVQLVPMGAGGNNYYPSYSPDGQFVVFNRAAADSYNAADARVMVVSTSPGNPAIDLAKINASPGNSWPKWAPFVQHFQGATVYWITFSSVRSYGLRGGTQSQLWMAAIPVGALSSGNDASYPAFWLPFQDRATGNHIAQWVEKVARQPCTQIDNSGCGPGETCQNGVCVPTIM